MNSSGHVKAQGRPASAGSGRSGLGGAGVAGGGGGPGGAGGAGGADVEELIDRLEAQINGARRVPLSTMVMIEEQLFLDTLDQLRMAGPQDRREAQRVVRERERIIGHAQAEADKIIRTASAEAQKMMDESEVVRAAQERAEGIVAEAEARAQELRRGAESYVLELLTGLDDELSRLLAQIKRGRAIVERARETAGGQDGSPSDGGLAHA